MKKLWRFREDYRRMGHLESLFLATDEQVDAVTGKTVYFGSVLGKHSEVWSTLDCECITLISEDQCLVNELYRTFGKDSLCGFNPLDHIEK